MDACERATRDPLTTITAMAETPTYERIEGLPVGQYVAYSFFKVDPAWRRLPAAERADHKAEFAAVVTDWQGRIEGLRAYSTVGVRPAFRMHRITGNGSLTSGITVCCLRNSPVVPASWS